MSFQQANPIVFQQLIKLYNNFVNNHPGNNYDITFYYEHFFVPYNDFCTNYLANGNQPFQELLDLALLTRDGKQLYGHIKSEHQILKEQLANDFKLIYRTLLDLRSNGKKLMSEI